MITKGATIEDIMAVLKEEWATLKTPEHARGHCTEYLSQLRYILNEFNFSFSTHSADIMKNGQYEGSHDFLMLGDGRVLDFTLSQFSLGLPWPFFQKPTSHFTEIIPLGLMEDDVDKKKAQKVIATKTHNR